MLRGTWLMILAVAAVLVLTPPAASLAQNEIGEPPGAPPDLPNSIDEPPGPPPDLPISIDEPPGPPTKDGPPKAEPDRAPKNQPRQPSKDRPDQPSKKKPPPKKQPEGQSKQNNELLAAGGDLPVPQEPDTSPSTNDGRSFPVWRVGIMLLSAGVFVFAVYRIVSRR